nr:hypothetical protein [Petrotoga sp. 8T1HF07.NaAc.6.1]
MNNNESNKKNNHILLTVFTWLTIFLAWYIVTKLEIFTPTLLPSPQRVWSAFLNLIRDGYNNIPLWVHIGTSFKRLFVSIAFAIIFALPIGLLSGYFKRVEAIIDSIVEFYRPLPPLAYYTILILWFGIGDLSKEVLLFFSRLCSHIHSLRFRCERNKPRLYIECKILGSRSNECVF